ncbi:MAG TPA: MBOAT family protein [Acetobacteraceae bacterium]|nr:MBOAT family protein [Acetobacteraceae bacterium]
MLFNSQIFVFFFLPLVLAGYYALAWSRGLRQAWVIAASIAFYGYWDIRFVPLLVGLTMANWLIALWFGRTRQNWIPLLGIVLNLCVLALFKYADFIRGSLFGVAGEPWEPWSLILPLGISFFVFQKISYLADLRRGDRHIYGFLDFWMFVTFFPQLIAGPLVRHNEIIPQFERDPRGPDTWENLGRGLVLFIIGLTKKVVLADTLAHLADPAFARAAHTTLTAAEAWVGGLAFTFQLYFDFSGYSDMAIGLALMFGLRLPINFNAPYKAVSSRDLWRRWHITLSRFLRDYLYVPLGGSRKGEVRQAFNVIVTMLLGGLWHGANWNCVAWGGLQGVGLAVNHLWDRAGIRLPRLLSWAITFFFFVFTLMVFHSPGFPQAGRFLASMFGASGLGHVVLDREHALALAGGAALAFFGIPSQDLALRWLQPRPWLAVPVGAFAIFVVLLVGGRLPNVFFYFQF